MSNNVLTYGLIARRAVELLENNLVMANQVYRGYEDEYSKNQNGYKTGDTITVRRPTQFALRNGPVAKAQDVTEGSLQIKVDTQVGVDFNFTSKDLTLDITDFSDRFIEPAMITIAQGVESAVSGLFKDVPNWVGTPGSLLSNFNSFTAATQRMDDTAIPVAPERSAILTPADARGMQASITGPSGIFNEDLVGKTYRMGTMGDIDGVKTFKSQNTPSLLTGSRVATGATLNGGVLSTTWLATKDTNQQVLTMTALGNGATVVQGDVFTLAGVFDVNPVSKAQLPYLKQFVVQIGGTADAGGNLAVTVSPPIIPAGATAFASAFQNVSAPPATNAAVSFMGAPNTTYANNLVFNKNAFSLVMVPLAKPEGGLAKYSRMSHKGINVRLMSGFDFLNDNNMWRFDVLFGVKTVDNRMAVRLSGSP